MNEPPAAVLPCSQWGWGKQFLLPGVSPCPKWNFPPAQEGSAGAALAAGSDSCSCSQSGSRGKGQGCSSEPSLIIIFHFIPAFSCRGTWGVLCCALGAELGAAG